MDWSLWLRALVALALFVAGVYGLSLAVDLDDAELLADLAGVDVFGDDRPGA